MVASLKGYCRIAVLTTFVIAGLGSAGCEYYDEKPTTLQGPAVPTSDEDLKALQNQIKALQEEVNTTKTEGFPSTANQQKIAELEKKIQELKDQLAAAQAPAPVGSPLSVIMTQPADGEKNVSVDLQWIGFKFNKQLTEDFGSAKANSLILSPSVSLDSGTPVDWEGEMGISLKKDTIHFNITDPTKISTKGKLEYDTDYTATLSGIKAADSSTMVGNYVLHFHTKKEEVPTVTGAGIGAKDSTIRISFSAPLNLKSMKDKESIVITSSNPDPIPLGNITPAEGEDPQYPQVVDIAANWHYFTKNTNPKLTIWGTNKMPDMAAITKSGTKMEATWEQSTCTTCHK